MFRRLFIILCVMVFSLSDGRAGEETLKKVAVYCGASPKVDPGYLEEAEAFGKALADNGIEIVYGGGSIGMMGRLADGCLQAGGRVHGIIPKSLQDKEGGHTKIQNLEVVENMHIRKAKMFDHADAIVVLPGGFGTLEETIEMLTWKQLSIHNKPIIVLDCKGYWAPFAHLLDHMVEEKFAAQKHRNMIHFVDSVDKVIPAIKADLTT